MKESKSNTSAELEWKKLYTAVQSMEEGNLTIPIPAGTSPEARLMGQALSSLQQKLLMDEERRKREILRQKTAISAIAHDLRAPLAVIFGYAEALQKEIAGTKERREKYLSAILLRSRDLSRLIDALSEINKASGSIAIHPMRLVWADVIQNCLSEWAEDLKEAHVKVRMNLDSTITVSLDPDAFRRIFANLTDNALKYRQKDRSFFSVELFKKGENAVFLYHDDGPGVPSEALLHLFDPWYRASAGRPGSGLGLYIVSQITAAHKGRASALNDHGLTIKIELPIAGGSSC